MFYHTYILTKRGPLAKIWLAAHWDRKLTKNDVKVIDLSKVVLNIIEPVVPISLRTSGELMLGVVRVYGHKVRILLKESQDVAQELNRGKDTHHATMSLGKGKNAVTNEAISAVTYTEPIDTNTLLPMEKGFDKEFAMIEHLVMNNATSSKPTEMRKHLSEEQSLINTWFRSGPDGTIDNQQYDPANTFLDFRSEVNRDFFHRREDSQAISDPSKKSSSSGSSIEALRRSSVMPPSAEKNRFHIDVGLPVEETAELPEIPDLAMRTPFKLPPYEEYGEMGVPMLEETPGQTGHQEPPRKKRLVLKQSLVDAGETVISSEVYRKTMKDRSEILSEYYRQGASFYPDEALPSLTDMAMLAEDRPWQTFGKMFGEKLKANTITNSKEDSPAEFGRQSLRGEADEPLPEFVSNLSPMQDFGQTELIEPPFSHAEMYARVEEQEKSSSAFLADLQTEASAQRVVIFDKLVHGISRRSVARHFGDLLALASRGKIQVKQDKPFNDILITV